MRAKTSFQALFFTLRGTWPTVILWPRVSIESANAARSFGIAGRPFLAAIYYDRGRESPPYNGSFALRPKQGDHYCACVYATWSAKVRRFYRLYFFDFHLLVRKTSRRRNAGCAKGTFRSWSPA